MKPKLPAAIFSVGCKPHDPNGWYDPKTDNWYMKQAVQPFPPGTYRVRMKRDTFFGGEDSKDYVSRPLTNPTWKTLLMQLRRAMAVTGDMHHCFLDGAGVVDGEYIELWTGS